MNRLSEQPTPTSPDAAAPAPRPGDMAAKLADAALELRERVAKLRFEPPTTIVYNPLEYAWTSHRLYLEKYGDSPKRVIFLGMNPGPWGMAQTGAPFGEVEAVKHWLGIETPVGKPVPEHPRRPVEGFACSRSEVSGQRFWKLFAERYGSAERFFTEHFVANYCPLAFMEESGRNRTPDKLPAAERERLFEACDAHLRRIRDILGAKWLIGVGFFAASRINAVFGRDPRVKKGVILHPSPASPAANRDWSGSATEQLIRQGVWER